MKLMDGIWGRSRARGYGMTALLAVVVFGASATAADAIRSASDEQPAGDVFVTPPSTPAATSSAGVPAPVAPVGEPTPAPQPAVTPSPTVQAMTEPAPEPAATTPEPPAPAPEPAPATPYDAAATWTDSAGKTFVPAPPPPMEKLPGEGQTAPGN